MAQDNKGAITDRTFLFASSMVVAFAAWAVLHKRRHVKVLVYHVRDDPYFEDFRRGIVRACDDRNMSLEYVSLAHDLPTLADILVDHISNGHADYYVCRIPSRAVAEALVRTGKPFASVKSFPGVVRRSEVAADIAGLEVFKHAARQLVVVDDPALVALGNESLPSYIQEVCCNRILEVTNGLKRRIDRVMVVSESLASKSVLDALHAMGLDVRIHLTKGYAHGQRAIEAVARYGYKA